jgi:hypothetical protein
MKIKVFVLLVIFLVSFSKMALAGEGCSWPSALQGNVYIRDPVTGYVYGLDGVDFKLTGGGGGNDWCKGGDDESINVQTSSNMFGYATPDHPELYYHWGRILTVWTGWKDNPGHYAITGGGGDLTDQQGGCDTDQLLLMPDSVLVAKNGNPPMCHTKTKDKECGINPGCNAQTASVAFGVGYTLPAEFVAKGYSSDRGTWQVTRQENFSCENASPSNSCVLWLAGNSTGILDFTFTPDLLSNPELSPSPTIIPTAAPAAECPVCSSGPNKALGNANCDNSVDLSDFSAWRREYFDIGAMGTIESDDWSANFNCPSDKTTDLIDFTTWLTNCFGDGGGCKL